MRISASPTGRIAAFLLSLAATLSTAVAAEPPPVFVLNSLDATVSVIDPKEQGKDLKRLYDKVPLLAMDNDADESVRLCYIGIDNYEAGKAAGRLIKKALPTGGVVGVFIGSVASANGKARSQGVLDELADQKDATGRTDKLAERPGLDGKYYGKYFVVQGGPITDDGKQTDRAPSDDLRNR